MLNALLFVQNFFGQRVRRDDRGVTAVEYGLILALIAGAIMATVFALGGVLNGVFNGIITQIGTLT